MAYFRVKWRRLPLAYRQFLEQRLLPGAPVIVVRDTSSWPLTKYGERHVFQVGARGGMSADEYLAEPDVPTADAYTWQQLAGRARRQGRLLGTDPAVFPADFSVFVRYTSALRTLPDAVTPWGPLSVTDAVTGLSAEPRVTVQTWAPR